MAKKMQVGVSVDAVFASRVPEHCSFVKTRCGSVAQVAQRGAELPFNHVDGIAAPATTH